MNTLQFQSPETAGLVSVIIPTRNGERFIGAALESIGRQTYGQWEVIVIEDGSHGETEGIVRSFAEVHRENRVHYQRNETSQGAAATRNRAFELASGQWIAFLDCDDRWLPDHLKTCVSALEESGDDVAYSAAAMCEDQTDHMLGFWGPTHGEIADFPQSLLGRSFVTPSATVVRRNLIGQVGPWNTTCRYCEDADFFLRAAALGKRFRHVGGVHCLYRKNHAGATTEKMAGTIQEHAEISSWFLAMPETQLSTSQRLVANTFALAARLHAKGDRAADPSVIRSRSAPLYYKAWRIRPTRLGYLLNSLRVALLHGWSPYHDAPTKASVSEKPLKSHSADRLAA